MAELFLLQADKTPKQVKEIRSIVEGAWGIYDYNDRVDALRPLLREFWLIAERASNTEKYDAVESRMDDAIRKKAVRAMIKAIPDFGFVKYRHKGINIIREREPLWNIYHLQKFLERTAHNVFRPYARKIREELKLEVAPQITETGQLLDPTPTLMTEEALLEQMGFLQEENIEELNRQIQRLSRDERWLVYTMFTEDEDSPLDKIEQVQQYTGLSKSEIKKMFRGIARKIPDIRPLLMETEGGVSIAGLWAQTAKVKTPKRTKKPTLTPAAEEISSVVRRRVGQRVRRRRGREDD